MNKIEVTSVKIRKINNSNTNVVGIASILLNHAFLVSDIKIIKNDSHIFCGMPSKKKNGKYIDICNPINDETRKEIENNILAEYIKMEV